MKIRILSLNLAILVFTGVVAAAQDSIDLRVVTYNIHHGEGTDKKFDLGRIARLIMENKPDLVAIQEVDVKTGRSSGVDQAAELGRLTGLHYKFGKFMDFDGGEYGQMVLSRFPIVRSTNHKLPDGPEPRAALAIEVEVAKSQRLIFVGNHLYGSEKQRIAQAQKLAGVLAPEIEKKTLIILAGDFNSTPKSKPMEILLKTWVDPTEDDDSRTWPSGTPKVEIDYVLHFPAARFGVFSSKVLPEKVASDHRPIFTRLGLVK